MGGDRVSCRAAGLATGPVELGCVWLFRIAQLGAGSRLLFFACPVVGVCLVDDPAQRDDGARFPSVLHSLPGRQSDPVHERPVQRNSRVSTFGPILVLQLLLTTLIINLWAEDVLDRDQFWKKKG